MSETYDRIRKERCEWCREGRGRAYVDESRHVDRCGLLSRNSPACTAPSPEAVIKEQATEIEALRNVCGEAYQLAGAVGAPVKVLDNLSAGMGGMPIPHETFLPVLCTDCSAVREAAARGQVKSEDEIREMRAILAFFGKYEDGIKALDWVLNEYAPPAQPDERDEKV